MEYGWKSISFNFVYVSLSSVSNVNQTVRVSVSQSGRQAVSQSASQSVCQSVSQSVSQSISQSVSQPDMRAGAAMHTVVTEGDDASAS